MSTGPEIRFFVEDVEVTLRRKPVRTLRLTVRPPEGLVHVSAPLLMPEAAIRSFIAEKLHWIYRHRERVLAAARPSARNMESGETVPWLGRPYRLEVRECGRGGRVLLAGSGILELYAPSGADSDRRRKILYEWYRERLKELIPPLLARWEAAIGVKTADWGVKRMKTRWGTCSIRARRIWLNLELATRPAECLEYVIVHELAHLLERSHDKRFKGLLDRFLPDWRELRAVLRNAPPAR